MFSFRQLILLILIAACLAGAAGVLPVVDLNREAYSRRTMVGTEASAPEIVLLTHLLGGFKSLLINAVWLRAAKLQQEEKFWELYQLYDWMGKLEPQMEEIWVFNGWNMAFNLVAELDNSEARWRWIERGLTLLRDQGLKYNPKSAKIMKEIAWIYQQKLGRDRDLHHEYYKHRWALIMEAIVGPLEFQDATELAKAPRRLEDLLADEDVAAALSQFQLKPPAPEIKAFDTVESPLRLLSSGPVMAALRRHGDESVRRKVRHYISSRILREDFKMKRMDIIERMENDFGTFDWRLPEPHAIYWATLASETDPNPDNQIDYDRIILYSLLETARRGQIAYLGPDPNLPMVMTYDFSKIEPVDQLFELFLKKYPYTMEVESRGGQSIRDGHIHFLMESAFNLYFAGYEQRALKLHLKLKERYDKPHPYVPLDEFVMGQVKGLIEEFGTGSDVRVFVDGLLVQAYFHYCANKYDQARRFERFAKYAWEKYRAWTLASAQGRAEKEKVLPTWKQIQTQMVRSILLGQKGFPPNYVRVLRQRLGIKEGAEKEEIRINDIIVPDIPDSSPTPKR